MSSFTGAKPFLKKHSEYNGIAEGERFLHYLILVCHHVPQTLIINYSKKDVNFKLTAVRTTVHSFRAVVVVTGWKIKIWVTGKNDKNIRENQPLHDGN